MSVPDGNGSARKFTLITSPAYDKNIPASVVLVFHGAGGTISDAGTYGFQEAIANAGDRGIVILPQGISFISGGVNYGVGWDETCGGYDMPLFDNLVKYASDHYCVDQSRVFVTGFSWGGDMSNGLACCRGNKIKGIAPFSGPERNNASCSTTKWPAVRVRYGGLDGAYSQSQFQSTMAFYLNKQACSSVSDPVSPSPCVSYRGCNAPVLECAFPTMIHQQSSPAEAADTWAFWKSLP